MAKKATIYVAYGKCWQMMFSYLNSISCFNTGVVATHKALNCIYKISICIHIYVMFLDRCSSPWLVSFFVVSTFVFPYYPMFTIYKVDDVMNEGNALVN